MTMSSRLLDIVHAEQKLYLVFEFLDVDLKRFMEQCNGTGGMPMDLVKVSPIPFGSTIQHPVSSSRMRHGPCLAVSSVFDTRPPCSCHVT
jgi:hypothetical protein